MTDNLVGFALKASAEDDFAGGSLAFRDGETFNLADALEENGGTIVVSDPRLIEALDGNEVLKRASVPDGAVPSDRQDETPAPAQVEEPPGDASNGDDEPPAVSVTMTRKDLISIAEAEIEDFDPTEYPTQASLVGAINDARKGD